MNEHASATEDRYVPFAIDRRALSSHLVPRFTLVAESCRCTLVRRYLLINFLLIIATIVKRYRIFLFNLIRSIYP